ncbi:MAG: hypothetical protein KatS3mg077_1209 [Candidatus Binatia bacterium]|nr:MAG: hypothetical protein KatS3mg077_1209 [Candidatus Binatia bacterium]
MSHREREDIDRTVAGQTVCTLFADAVAKYPDLDALKWKSGDAWQSLTWQQYGERVRKLAAGLVRLGVEPGKFVAILASNRPEHYLVDLAALHAGAIPVTIYSTLAPPQIEYIMNHCEAVAFVAENPDVYAKVAAIRANLPKLRHVVVIDQAEQLRGEPGVLPLASLESAAAEASIFEEVEKTLESRSAAGPGHPHLHVGHNWTTERGHGHSLQRVLDGGVFGPIVPPHPRHAPHFVPASGPYRRAHGGLLPAPQERVHLLLLPEPPTNRANTCAKCAPNSFSQCRESGKSSMLVWWPRSRSSTSRSVPWSGTPSK